MHSAYHELTDAGLLVISVITKQLWLNGTKRKTQRRKIGAPNQLPTQLKFSQLIASFKRPLKTVFIYRAAHH